LQSLGIIDGIIEEPLGAAHRGPEAAITAVGDHIEATLDRFTGMDGASLRAQRREKFLAMGNGSLA